MADGDGSKALKVVLWVLGIAAVLGIVCCVGGYALVPKEVKGLFGEGVQMAKAMAAGTQAMDAAFPGTFGEDANWQFGGGGNEAMLLVGVSGEVDDARAAELQDAAWRLYASSFAQGGVPLTGVAIGTPGKRQAAGSCQGAVNAWSRHVVDAETLIERTGVQPPPASEFFESLQRLQDEQGVQVEVKVGGEGEPPAEETPAEQPPADGE